MYAFFLPLTTFPQQIWFCLPLRALSSCKWNTNIVSWLQRQLRFQIQVYNNLYWQFCCTGKTCKTDMFIRVPLIKRFNKKCSYTTLIIQVILAKFQTWVMRTEYNICIQNVYIFFCFSVYNRLSLSRSWRVPLTHFEISVLRHIGFSELRKLQIAQPNFTNDYVIRLL